MLVLSRCLMERIIIGEGPEAVTVTVVQIDRGKVRLAIDAPKTVRVDRQEVRDRINAEAGK